MKKRSVRDLAAAELRGRRALVRVDFNVPLGADDAVADDTRIRAALPTIQLLLDAGARVVLLSHLGRPKGKPDPKYSLEPVARHLATLLPKARLCFVESTDTDEAQKATHDPNVDVLLLENTRFMAGEFGFLISLVTVCCACFYTGDPYCLATIAPYSSLHACM